jgi:hypothetical protein
MLGPCPEVLLPGGLHTTTQNVTLASTQKTTSLTLFRLYCAPARLMVICLSSNRQRVAIALLGQAFSSRPVLADTGSPLRLEGSRQRQLVRARIHPRIRPIGS